jgi:hypothetical protein
MAHHLSTSRAATSRLAAVASITLAVGWVGAGSASAATGGYHSPGYAGKTNFGTVKPTALPPISLGTGKYPSLLVDGAGTAHVVFVHDGGASAPDTYSVCNLQRGSKQCASASTVPAPVAPAASQGGAFEGNFPAGNHDFDGPAPLDIGNELFVIERRFPDAFPAPGSPTGTSGSNVFEWSSSDGGVTLTGPGDIGDNQMAGGAVAYGDASGPSIGTISRTETGGTFFQGTDPGTYTNEIAQLGTGDQAYDGELADDDTTPIARPVAAFDDLSGNTFVREYSGAGDVNDPANWSESSFRGYAPQIVGGAAGVFVLSSDSDINGGTLSLRRIVGGQPVGTGVPMGKSASPPAITEDASGRISFAYTDSTGIEVRSSTDGVHFSGAQLVAALPSGTSVGHLELGVTADGGGFATYVKNATGAEGIGQVLVSAFGTEVATHLPGLGPLPGGGIGSAAGDHLATSTCSTATFGVVEADIYPAGAGCFSHVASNPNLDVTKGTLNLNGLQIIPDPGVTIGIDPKQHTVDTTGPVKVVLTAGGVSITLFHAPLHIQTPDDGPGDTLVDFKPADLKDLLPTVQGFPIDGDVDIKLAKGGVDIPISLSLPKVFGGITGAAILHADTATGLRLKSLEFTIGDLNLAALELKKVDVSYTEQGDVWKGMGTLEIPSGGGALSTTIVVEFDNGDFKSGSLDLGLTYPGIPLDDDDPTPVLYLSHAGLGLSLAPLTLTGDAGLGLIPLAAPGAGDPTKDYAIRLEGQLSVAFGTPVTVTATATGFLYNVQLTQAKLIYKFPDQVSLNATSDLDLDLVQFHGELDAVVDPAHKAYGGEIKGSVTFNLPAIPDFTSGGLDIVVSSKGFGVYVDEALFSGTVGYLWGDDFPTIHAGDYTSHYRVALPQALPAGANVAGAHAASAPGFTVPAGAPNASVTVHGTGGAPSVVLVSPSGEQITPTPGFGTGPKVVGISQPNAQVTDIGLNHPQAGHWSVLPAPANTVAISSVAYAIGERAPTITAHVAGHGAKRTVRYHASLPDGVTIALAEHSAHLMHTIGTVHNGSGTIPFTPAFGPGGTRQLTAQIANNGMPVKNLTLGSYTVPAPARPGRAANLRVRAVRGAFRYSFRTPTAAVRTLVTITASDGRHLQRTLGSGVHHGSVPVIGYGDALTVSVRGVRVDGVKGPSVSATARINLPTVTQPKPHRTKKHGRSTHHAGV